MNIKDKAESSDSREVRLARDSIGVYRLESEELTAADEISSDDEFPKYGDFLDVITAKSTSPPQVGPELWVECPGELAATIIELELAVGDWFRIQSVRKDANGEWTYSVEKIDDPTA